MELSENWREEVMREVAQKMADQFGVDEAKRVVKLALGFQADNAKAIGTAAASSVARDHWLTLKFLNGMDGR